MGVATRVESCTLHSRWRIVVGDKYLIIDEHYYRAETYSLVEHAESVDMKKATEQMPIIMWQIHQFIAANKPKPPKRYR